MDIQWRRPFPHTHRHKELNVDDVLFSVCVDGKVRIWAASDPHGLQGMQLWAEIDMQQSLQPRQLGDLPIPSDRLVFFIDSHEFAVAAEAALRAATNEKGSGPDHAIEHLAEISKSKPDVCVILDRHGNMSAWGLENVGCKARKASDIFNIAHVENFNLPFALDLEGSQENVRFLSFCTNQTSPSISLLTHHFDGRVTWHEGRLDEMFDPSPRLQRLTFDALWSGHKGQVQKIRRDLTGRALMSSANGNEGLIWKHALEEGVWSFKRQSSLNSSDHILRTCVLNADRVVVLHEDRISLWDTRESQAQELSSSECKSLGKTACLFTLPDGKDRSQAKYVTAMTLGMSGIVWKVTMTLTSLQEGERGRWTIEEFATFDIKTAAEIIHIHPFDQSDSSSGTASVDSSLFDRFAKDTAISCSEAGTIFTWAANLDFGRKSVAWYTTSTVRTNLGMPSIVSASSTRKVAVVDKAQTRLTIWDIQNAQLEYDKSFDPLETIQDLDWCSTPDQKAVCAISFSFKVIVLAQMRYDFACAGPTWAPIREVNIKDLTFHPIGDSAWLGRGNLVIAAGNQMYVYDENISTTDEMFKSLKVSTYATSTISMFDLLAYLNGPLPVYEPQFLSQCISYGKLPHVLRTLAALQVTTKYLVEGERLDSYLNLPLHGFFANDDGKNALLHPDHEDEEESTTLTEELAMNLTEKLATLSLPHLPKHHQSRLISLVESVATAEKLKRSMDEDAMRFHIFYNQFLLFKRKSPAVRMNITCREYIWAFRSNSQDILVDLVSRQFNGRILWHQARESGMFMWMTDLTALVSGPQLQD